MAAGGAAVQELAGNMQASLSCATPVAEEATASVYRVVNFYHLVDIANPFQVRLHKLEPYTHLCIALVQPVN